MIGPGPQPPVPRDLAQAVLTIDLGAIADNWRLLARRVAPAECAAVVKADAYGCGLEPVAQALARAGCRTFFVAHASEAARLRDVLGDAATLRVYVLNAMAWGDDGAAALVDVGARPVIGSRAQWDSWMRLAPQRPMAVHVDSGMNRLGMSLDDARWVASQPQARHVDLVMTHFISSEVTGDPRNDAQIALFAQARPLFAQARASLANSSGVFLPQAPYGDLVRPGYALYGGNPKLDVDNPMKPVVRLEAPLLQVRDVEPPATVGYNATWAAPGPRRLATLGLGYADGIPRAASGAHGHAGGEAIVNGVRCPFVGRVSMDLIVIDVTEAGDIAPHTLAQVLGPDITVDDLAARAGTIGYEILTGLGPRYARVYVGG